jgi:hypothetical protein
MPYKNPADLAAAKKRNYEANKEVLKWARQQLGIPIDKRRKVLEA